MLKSTLSHELRASRLALPQGKIRAVIDSDAATEIDDHFAISYAIASADKIDLQAIIAAPFFKATVSSPEEGMTKSYEAIKMLLKLMDKESDGVVFKGAPHFMPDRSTPVDTEGRGRSSSLPAKPKQTTRCFTSSPSRLSATWLQRY